ncbi:MULTISPECIES: DMT family transporter [Sphingobacterium]|jgi:small multidrug resistance pump|uniref:Multidrug resistance protein DLP12 prophage n=1 Tax=Sphingobacterium multivorum TaxID=28454 RepID=A0A654DKK8_SPHMU|nr:MULTISPECIES: multidrug efflux SMR transporter [Sphingobacterium]HAE69051.1 QacE family quaternary ammonium compound efflux SMR transporter [Sphingobacterium sp.]OFV20813.1 multidrug transporter [Sphingobacterium sp. HMSC13C05]OJZ01137.1 MAG: QacE family quaternary ammonium compound efflux SMR transporter [Sphingobacterium sp. 40-24]QQT46011.1 multidrug efflux SMR transporter [Sphingobacterium multivorum]QQT61350.1 multidrug efflux SMR transporter [Sphingobacterium multivorum]
MKYTYLFLAIAAEIFATTFLKKSAGFTLIKPTILCIVGYIIAFYFLSITLKYLPVGISYAIWSGVGIVAITLIGMFLFKQIPDTAAIIGMVLIVVGVIIINLFSKMGAH